MKCKTFLRTAYPESMAQVEAERSNIWKANRWLGLRFAYLFYRVGFSGNLLSITRVILALIGFYLVSLAVSGSKWGPMLGALILAWQINLDYADGAIARVQGKSSALGEKIDGLANASSRFAVLILSGFLTGNVFIFLTSAFSAYIVVVFLPQSRLRIKTSGNWQLVALFFRILLYVPVMVFGLPFLIALHGVFSIKVVIFAYSIVWFYAVLAVIWLVLCLLYSGAKESALERIDGSNSKNPANSI